MFGCLITIFAILPYLLVKNNIGAEVEPSATEHVTISYNKNGFVLNMVVVLCSPRDAALATNKGLCKLMAHFERFSN